MVLPIPYGATVEAKPMRSYGRNLFGYVITYACGTTRRTFGYAATYEQALSEGQAQLAWLIADEQRRDLIYGPRTPHAEPS